MKKNIKFTEWRVILHSQNEVTINDCFFCYVCVYDKFYYMNTNYRYTVTVHHTDKNLGSNA